MLFHKASTTNKPENLNPSKYCVQNVNVFKLSSKNRKSCCLHIREQLACYAIESHMFVTKICLSYLAPNKGVVFSKNLEDKITLGTN